MLQLTLPAITNNDRMNSATTAPAAPSTAHGATTTGRRRRVQRQKSTPLLLVDYSKSRAKEEPMTLASSVSLHAASLCRRQSGTQLFPRTTRRPLRRQLSTDMLDSAILVTNRLLDLPMNSPLEDTNEVLAQALQFVVSQEVDDLEVPSAIAVEPEAAQSPPGTSRNEPQEVMKTHESQPSSSDPTTKKASSAARASWELNESLLNLDTSSLVGDSDSDSEDSFGEDSDSESEDEESECDCCDADEVSRLSQDSASVLQDSVSVLQESAGASVSSFFYGDDDTATARETVTSTGDSDSVSFRVRKVSMRSNCPKRSTDQVPSAVVRLENSLTSMLGVAPSGMPDVSLLGGSSMKDESEQDLLLPVKVMNEKVPARRTLLNYHDYKRESARSLIQTMQETRRSSRKLTTEDTNRELLGTPLSKLKKPNRRRSKSRTRLGMERSGSSPALDSQRNNRSRIRRTNSSRSTTRLMATRPLLSKTSPLERTHSERCLMSPETSSAASPITDDSRRTNRRRKNKSGNRRSSLDSSSSSIAGDSERRAIGRKPIQRTKSKDFSASLIGASLQWQPNHANPYGGAMNDVSCNSHFDQDQTSGDSLRSTLARLKKLTQKPQHSSSRRKA